MILIVLALPDILKLLKQYLLALLLLALLSTGWMMVLAAVHTYQLYETRTTERQSGAFIGTSGKDPLIVTWYDPRLGGINCEPYCDGYFANGEKVTAAHYFGGSKQTAACIREWLGLRVTIAGLGTFVCRDRGGSIVRRKEGIHIDILSKTAVVCPQPCRYVVHLPPSSLVNEPCNFSNPYSGQRYWITQGAHGFSYNHAAIDVSAGKDAPTLSPITGTVVGNARDGYGNPTLVIENDCYRVEMLHGRWTVAVGEQVQRGELLGYESNIGYTTTIGGRFCGEGSNCGYHLHINVFDKKQGRHVTAELVR